VSSGIKGTPKKMKEESANAKILKSKEGSTKTGTTCC